MILGYRAWPWGVNKKGGGPEAAPNRQENTRLETNRPAHVGAVVAAFTAVLAAVTQLQLLARGQPGRQPQLGHNGAVGRQCQ